MKNKLKTWEILIIGSSHGERWGINPRTMTKLSFSVCQLKKAGWDPKIGCSFKVNLPVSGPAIPVLLNKEKPVIKG